MMKEKMCVLFATNSIYVCIKFLNFSMSLDTPTSPKVYVHIAPALTENHWSLLS